MESLLLLQAREDVDGNIGTAITQREEHFGMQMGEISAPSVLKSSSKSTSVCSRSASAAADEN